MLVAERAARQEAEAAAVQAKAEAAKCRSRPVSHEALIAHLKLEIEKLRRQLYGQRAERKERLLDQLELQLEELEASATEDELAAEAAANRHRRFDRSRAGERCASPSRKIWARADCPCRPEGLPVLRIGQLVEAWRGRDRDPGDSAATLEADRDGARSSRAAPARRLRSRRRRSMPRHAASSGRRFWRRSCSTSSASITAESAERALQARGH